MKRMILLALGVNILFCSTSLLAQKSDATVTASEQDIQLLRKDLQSDKKMIVAANMSLTEQEAKSFWPVYDQYVADLAKVNDAKLAVIKEYATNYDKLTDTQARDLVQKWTAADQQAIQLRLSYVPKFQNVLPGKKVARFYQIDHRIGVALDLQMASEIPLVEP
jgi:hypothetical protein